MSFDLREKAKENIIVIAHRGVAGGNIPCNTLASYEIALKQGADVLEVDVSCSADGKLFLFHPGMEMAHLGLPISLKALPMKAIEKIHYINGDMTKTQFPISTFDEFLERFKGRCFINIDKFWSNPERIYEAVSRHSMEDQILVKSKLGKNTISTVQDICPKLAFMPIVTGTHPMHEELMKSGINYVGVETLFSKDSDEVASEGFLEKMHRDGILTWANAIIYDHKKQIAAGHSDDTALTKSEDEGWGWLVDRGFDMIQTDWTGMLVDYLKRTDRYYK